MNLDKETPNMHGQWDEKVTDAPKVPLAKTEKVLEANQPAANQEDVAQVLKQRHIQEDMTSYGTQSSGYEDQMGDTKGQSALEEFSRAMEDAERRQKSLGMVGQGLAGLASHPKAKEGMQVLAQGAQLVSGIMAHSRQQNIKSFINDLKDQQRDEKLESLAKKKEAADDGVATERLKLAELTGSAQHPFAGDEAPASDTATAEPAQGVTLRSAAKLIVGTP